MSSPAPQLSDYSAEAARTLFRTRYGIDERALGELLDVALSRGGDYADLYFEHRQTSSIAFEESKVKTAGGGITQGLGVRVLSGDSTGYAYTEDLSLDSMRQAAATAAKICDRLDKVGPVDVADQAGPDRYRIAKPSIEIPSTEKLAIIRRADEAARAYDPSITRVNVSFVEEVKHVMVATSDGRLMADFQPMLRFNVQCLSEVGNSRQTAIDGGGGRLGMEYFVDHTPEELARNAARMALTQQQGVDAPAGTIPVVLGAGESGILLHEAVGHGLEADFNRKQTSMYSGRVGKPVASELCTVIDDGTIVHSRGTINVDDEGNVAKKNVLIQDGVLQGYLQDRISARHFGVEASGNGRRESFRHYPMPRMTNTYMLPGESTPEDIIKSVKKGLYAKAFSGGQVNISKGDFVFSVTEGYLIEDGEVTHPVKNVNIIGNGPDALSKVTMVGNDFQLSDGRWTCGKDGQSVPVGVGMPTVLVSGITVGGTQR